MSITDELLQANQRYAQTFTLGRLPMPPARKVAVLACMDARLTVEQILGLNTGDAHIIRNAGGVVTDDVIRSLVVSQRLMKTQEIILVHHTNCGLQTVTEDAFKAELEAEVGIKPWWALECFTDPYADVLQSINRLQHSPFVRYKDHIRGYVYDVTDGRLHEGRERTYQDDCCQLHAPSVVARRCPPAALPRGACASPPVGSSGGGRGTGRR